MLATHYEHNSVQIAFHSASKINSENILCALKTALTVNLSLKCNSR